MSVLQHSTFLDAFGNKQATPDQFEQLARNSPGDAAAVLGELYGIQPSAVTSGFDGTVTVGLVLNRANPDGLDSLLQSPWAERQAFLQDQDAVWAAYGADLHAYNHTVSAVDGILAPSSTGGSTPAELATQAGYMSAAQNRTLWLTLDAAQFEALFHTPLLTVTLSETEAFPAWGGNLELDDSIATDIGGVWVEERSSIPNPAVLDTTQVDPSPLADGYLGIGNGHLDAQATPEAVAGHYNYPLTDGQQTPTIALVEVNLPDANSQALFEAYNQYRASLHLPTLTAEQFTVLTMPGGAQAESWPTASELALDISVISGAAPTSALKLYAYQSSSDATGSLIGTPFNAYQRAFFDPDGPAQVLSSSCSLASQPTPDSPFQWAWQQLFIDGALSRVSVHLSAGDQGSSANIPNGIANVPNSQSSPMALIVGGTSIADRYTAFEDPTLVTMAESVIGADPDLGILRQLVAAGLTTLPSQLPDDKPSTPQTLLQGLFETVWQRLQLTSSGGSTTLTSPFGENMTGTGGTADGVPIPFYQAYFGLGAMTGGDRGTPDVSALAGGDYRYTVLNPDFDPSQSPSNDNPLTMPDGGTSAAAPLWAALTAQFDAVFADQGLPQLGFYNDLLYTAAVVAPASFNDIQLGNNINSFYLSTTPTGYYNSNYNQYMVPTGKGYEALPGYDLATGLGTPNGVLLGRALVAIARSQVNASGTSGIPGILAGSSGNWTSAANQSLLFQPMFSKGSATAVQVALTVGDTVTRYTSATSSDLAWDSRLAGQSLQENFDSSLVAAFDNQIQARPLQFWASEGDSLAVSLGRMNGQALQQALTNPYGFADFFVGGDADGPNYVRIARPLAVAETLDNGEAQTAIVRLRQGGSDDYRMMFYRVDDLVGSIGDLQPGDPGYYQAIRGRAYELSTGGIMVAGPGEGNFSDSTTFQVENGDLVAMWFRDTTTERTFLSFSEANDAISGRGNARLWNYGLNTWGWEDFSRDGVRDFNDLVVQLDFTSAAGSGPLS